MRRFLHRLLNRTPVRVEATATQTDALEDQQVPTQELVSVCDGYWKRQLQPAGGGGELSAEDVKQYKEAIELLPERGKQVVRWCVERLKHPNPEARAQVAALLGRVGSSDDLGTAEDQMVQALGQAALIRTKDAPQGGSANIAAIAALGEIRNHHAIAALRQILVAADWPHDDLRWEAADALEQVTGEPFMSTGNPVKHAREWLQANPDE